MSTDRMSGGAPAQVDAPEILHNSVYSVTVRDRSGARSKGRGRAKTRRCLQTLAFELTVAESRERERIARGLHDVIGQVLTMARFKIGELREAALPEARNLLMDELGELLAQATRATRSATFDLSCPSLQLGLLPALESLAHRMRQETKLLVRVEGHLPEMPIPESVVAVLFRVAREFALNAHKHAHASSLCFELRSRPDELSICVADDGNGFQRAELGARFSPDGGFGLFSVEAQVEAIGGHVKIDTAPGRGTRATVILPLPGNWPGEPPSGSPEARESAPPPGSSTLSASPTTSVPPAPPASPTP
jgi:signal transduction histidine kinase